METRELRLIKNGQRYLFRFVPGHEREILDEIRRQAEDGRSGITLMDAARLTIELARQVADEGKVGA